MRMSLKKRSRGQALVEFALVFPIFAMALFGIISVGLWVFYNQQLQNAAREGARYAAVHSATAQCPTVSSYDPIDTLRPEKYARCDPPPSWPFMTTAARSKVWAIAPTNVHVAACWSGYMDPSGNRDALPEPPNVFTECTMNGADPVNDIGAVACPASSIVDRASATSYAAGTVYPTRVTVYACMNWQPPMAGFLLIPTQITMRAAVDEVLHRQS